MKKLIFCLMILSSSYCFGQIEYSVELSPGFFFPNSHNYKLGIGALAAFNVQPSEHFIFSISSGYAAWGYNNGNEYNTQVVPIILSARYKFNSSSFSPYISGEYHYLFGEVDYIKYKYGIVELNPEKATENVEEFGFGLGAGLIIPFNFNLGMDIGSGILLNSKNENLLNVRTTFGIYYRL